MRLRIYGIPRWALFCFGLLPAVMWFSFHPNDLLFRREARIWVSVLGLLGAWAFPFFLRRGLFRVRFALYSAIGAVILSALIPSIPGRDFTVMAGSLFFLMISIALGFWLEKRLSSAGINPDCEWYDGKPRGLAGVRAVLQVGGSTVMASVRKIDFEGCFVFFDSPVSLTPLSKVGLRVEVEGVPVEGEGRVMALFRGENTGAGLQFLVKDLYHLSLYTGLVQRLRGKGL